MRPQGKPFTVQKKKSRKPRASGETRFGLMGVQPAVAETLSGSGNLAAAERIFRPMGVPADPPRPEYSVQNSGFPGAAPSSAELASRRAVEQAAANRILPDLSRHEPLQGARKDETSMAAKPTRSRVRRKQRREPEAQRGSRGRPRRPAAVETSAVEPVVEENLAEQPIETRMPARAPATGGSAKAGSEPPGRLKRRRKWSPREIRRAAASGAFKTTVAGTRNRKRR
jgi:hypothetical protein